MWFLVAVINEYRKLNGKPILNINGKAGAHETSLYQDILYYFRRRVIDPDSVFVLAESLAKA